MTKRFTSRTQTHRVLCKINPKWNRTERKVAFISSQHTHASYFTFNAYSLTLCIGKWLFKVEQIRIQINKYLEISMYRQAKHEGKLLFHTKKQKTSREAMREAKIEREKIFESIAAIALQINYHFLLIC